LSDDWHTHDWRFNEIVTFIRNARHFENFPLCWKFPHNDTFWPEVLRASINPGENPIRFVDMPMPPPDTQSLAEKLIPNKKLVVERMCAYCHKQTAKSICSKCKDTWYCNKECQKAAWKTHKKMCKPLEEAIWQH